VSRFEDADRVYREAQDRLGSDDAQFPLARVQVRCFSDKVALPDEADLRRRLARTHVQPVLTNLFDLLLERMELGKCARVDPRYLRSAVEAFLSNPRLPSDYRRAGLHMRGRLYAMEGNLDGAVRSLEAGDEISPSLVSIQLQATWLASADLYDDALRAVQRGRNDPRWPPAKRTLYAPFFEAWERQLREGLASRAAH